MNEDLDLVAGGAPPPAFEVVVFGGAKAAGSKRAFVIKKGGIPTNRASVTDANPNSKAWKRQVAQVCGEAWGDNPVLDEALSATFTFYRMRPKGHFGVRGLRPSAAQYPTTRPDLLKLARGVEDAMSKVVYRDDSLIVSHHLHKRFGTPERVVISIRSMDQSRIEMFTPEELARTRDVEF